MSVAEVYRERSVNALRPPETREEFRSVLYREFLSAAEVSELLQVLASGDETASAVFWCGTFYVGATYRGEHVVWKVRASSVRSVPTPSHDLCVEVRRYLNAMDDLDADPEQNAATLESLARTLCWAIRKEVYPREDPDESPILLVTVVDECFVLDREQVIGSCRAGSILVV